MWYLTGIVGAYVAYDIINCNYIKVDNIRINNEEPRVKIVQLSDIHIRKSEHNRINKILDKVKEINPDVITITGDLLDSVILDDSLEYFCSEIVKIAPVLAVSGNHEELFPDYEKWKTILKKHGIKILDNESIEIKDVVFVGVKTEEIYDERMVEDIKNISSKKIVLLAHKPELFEKYYNRNNKNNPDIVLCGHAHGGQWRLFNRGLFAPQQGLLPKYTSGIYQSKECKTVMLVSRGLGHCAIPIRFNNSFHMPVIEI